MLTLQTYNENYNIQKHRHKCNTKCIGVTNLQNVIYDSLQVLPYNKLNDYLIKISSAGQRLPIYKIYDNTYVELSDDISETMVNAIYSYLASERKPLYIERKHYSWYNHQLINSDYRSSVEYRILVKEGNINWFCSIYQNEKQFEMNIYKINFKYVPRSRLPINESFPFERFAPIYIILQRDYHNGLDDEYIHKDNMDDVENNKPKDDRLKKIE